jgi:hypothetical protein
MNRYERLSPINKRYLDVMTDDQQAALWQMVDAIVDGIKNRQRRQVESETCTTDVGQMSDNSAMNILWAAGQQLTALRNAEVRHTLELAHRNGVSLHEEGMGIRHE